MCLLLDQHYVQLFEFIRTLYQSEEKCNFPFGSSEVPALHPRQWSGSHDSQLGPPSRDTSADRASLFAARTRRSNSSEALIERAPSEDPLLPSASPFKSTEALTPSTSSRNPRPSCNDLIDYLDRRPFGELLYTDDSAGPYTLDSTEHPPPGTLV
ncbi:hypothetical protein lerEdw1_014716 [Lerista edwardsae]|nr:hypothetical protein lerEdw1_014716 [Lerista edwardsae]